MSTWDWLEELHYLECSDPRDCDCDEIERRMQQARRDKLPNRDKKL